MEGVVNKYVLAQNSLFTISDDDTDDWINQYALISTTSVHWLKQVEKSGLLGDYLAASDNLLSVHMQIVLCMEIPTQGRIFKSGNFQVFLFKYNIYVFFA